MGIDLEYNVWVGSVRTKDQRLFALELMEGRRVFGKSQLLFGSRCRCVRLASTNGVSPGTLIVLRAILL